MTDQPSRVKVLFEKYSNKEANPEEIRELFELSRRGADDREFLELLVARLEDTQPDDNYNKEIWDDVFARVKDDIDAIEEEVAPLKRKSFNVMRYAAAIVMLVIGAGLFYYKVSNPEVEMQRGLAKTEQIAPGKTGATLTLGNGQKILLADALKGELAEESGVSITKTSDGQITYTVKETIGGAEQLTATNTLYTSKGETIALRLPDGSSVTLNAASSLSYPANFIRSKERRVKLTGEGYFEIAKDKTHPFIVETERQRVAVLGTHFNINAYADDATTRTTLLEGSVKVSTMGQGTIATTLKPNQQSENRGEQITIKDVEAEDAIAWKNGYFMFNSETLESAMNRISRWYNVELVYESPGLKDKTFFGRVSRSADLNKVLDMLEGTDIVQFKVEGRKIRISKK